MSVSRLPFWKYLVFPVPCQLTSCVDLTDDAELCGGFLVWLTKTFDDRSWLSDRFLSATWDVDELVEMKEAIIKSDMFKARKVVA